MTNQKIAAVLVDDHEIFRQGLKMVLSAIENIEVVGEASNGKEFLELLPILKPQLVLMDIKMPEMNGIDATKNALKTHPDLKIIALSMFGEAEYYNQMLEAGVKGFVLKNSNLTELRSAIAAAIAGKSFFSQELLQNLVTLYKFKDEYQNVKLTQRELDVLKLICEGFSNAEIGEKLFVSQRTVETHRANLLSKTNTKNSIQLVVFAIKHKLYEVQ